MKYEEIIGLTAGIFTAASLLPQLIKTVKERDAANLSAVMLLVLLVGNSLWVYYGSMKSDLPIVVTNSFSLLINIFLIIFSFIYKKHSVA